MIIRVHEFISLVDFNFHGLVVDKPPSISSVSEKSSAAALGWLQFILLSYFGKWVFNHLNNGYILLFVSFGARPDIKANIPSRCRNRRMFRGSKVANWEMHVTDFWISELRERFRIWTFKLFLFLPSVFWQYDKCYYGFHALDTSRKQLSGKIHNTRTIRLKRSETLQRFGIFLKT